MMWVQIFANHDESVVFSTFQAHYDCYGPSYQDLYIFSKIKIRIIRTVIVRQLVINSL